MLKVNQAFSRSLWNIPYFASWLTLTGSRKKLNWPLTSPVASVAGVLETNLGLPIDTYQATKFLDDHDLQDVLNKMPDEAFDLLTGNCACDTSG